MRAPRVTPSRARFALNLSLGLNILVLLCLLLQADPLLIASHFPEHLAKYDLAAPGLSPRADQVGWRAGEQGSIPAGGSCDMCTTSPALCEEVGEAGLAKAVSYAGSNDRLRRVLARMKAGEPFTVGVIGGSVSRGHGLAAPDGDNANDPKNLNRIIFDHLDALFPQAAGTVLGESGRDLGKNGFVNGALGGTGSDYFSLCLQEHIPEDVDLVIVELAINDEVLLRNMDSYELLVRSILDLPRKPAILNLNVFALMFAQVANGGDLHSGIAQYYDLPILSLRNVFLHEALANVSVIRELFHQKSDAPADDLSDVDLRHHSPEGHRLLGQLASAYIDSQLCEMAKLEAKVDTTDIEVLYPSPPLPRMRVVSKYDQNTQVPTLQPNCFPMTTGGKNRLTPLENKGWREWNWEAKNYLIADEPGSTVTFGFSTQLGSVQLHYLRSASFGLGTVFCWVDDELDKGVTIVGYWNEIYNIGRAATIRADLKAGEHLLHCELLETTADPKGGREFRIISLMR
ncbi:hypothetical protein EHS25_006115 [Saitozyma podzolica]|uniref:SGNH hydrolase-type esterase domain-containing protein n=1 Tax=Saitozyma podzolica TaxID=1890683 RepID=A0A427XTF2_9TREE|nr:hypothetical protein EHS25_006115 [Saitozyma podzolica]